MSKIILISESSLMEFEGLIHKNTQIGPQLRVRIFFLEDETNFLISNRFKYKIVDFR